MTHMLDNSRAGEIAQEMVSYYTDEGYEPGEIIPGLLAAIKALARRKPKAYFQIIDEAVAMLEEEPGE